MSKNRQKKIRTRNWWSGNDLELIAWFARHVAEGFEGFCLDRKSLKSHARLLHEISKGPNSARASKLRQEILALKLKYTSLLT